MEWVFIREKNQSIQWLYEYIEELNLKICVINVKMYQDKIRQEMGMSGEK